MANLTLDSQYADSYSECGSSDSSFSYGLLTPTSSAEFSAATSRRQSIASELQPCNESAFDGIPSFSREGVTTPLETPPRFRSTFHPDNHSSITQAFETEPSPTGIQRRRRYGASSTSSVPQLHDPFTSQIPYFSEPTTSGLDIDIQGANQRDDCALRSRLTCKPLMDWSGSFSNAFEQGYDQRDSAQMAEALSFDHSSKIDLDYVHPDLFTAPAYLEFDMVNDTIVGSEPPRTVVPQETFVCPNSSFVPSTPICQPLETAFQTPLVKFEPKIPEPAMEDTLSPCSSLPAEEKLAIHASSGREHQEPIVVRAQSSSRRLTRSSSSKVKKTPGARTQDPRYPFDYDTVNSSKKKHICSECNIKFDRPEHWKRHTQAEIHIKRCEELGIPTESNGDTKPWKCIVEGCKTAVTRRDNLKPHYQKTHFFERFILKDGKRVENKKRRLYVSPEEAVELGLGHMDPRTDFGREQLKSRRTVNAEFFDDAADS